MRAPLLWSAIGLLAGVLWWLLFVWQPTDETQASHGQLALRGPPVGGDFELMSSTGAVRLSDFRGQVVLIYLGYTACPDICPTNLAILAAALQTLDPDERERVQVLFISVDPERDGLQRLAEYVAYFHPSFIGLTGSDDEIAEIAARYGAAYQRHQQGSAMGYLVDHSAYTYVVDPAGKLAEVLGHATPSDQILSVVRALLATPS